MSEDPFGWDDEAMRALWRAVQDVPMPANAHEIRRVLIRWVTDSFEMHEEEWLDQMVPRMESLAGVIRHRRLDPAVLADAAYEAEQGAMGDA